MTKESSGFRKSLSLFDSTAIVAGSMIGSGIFIVSADIARTLGSPGWIMVIWLVSGILTIIAALSYGELAALMPHAGGQYVYLREAYNPLSGFLYGWTLFLVIQTGTIAAVAMAFAKYTGVFLPWFSEKSSLIELGRYHFSTAQLLAIGCIIFLTLLNTRGVQTGKHVQNAFTSFKVLTLLAFIVIGLLLARNSESIAFNLSIFWDATTGTRANPVSLTGMALLAALGTAMVGGLFSSDAWNNITFAAEEVKNPKRDVALSLFLGTLLVTIIYLLANTIYMLALPVRGNPDGLTVMERGVQFATNDRLGSASMQGIFGNYAAVLMAVIVVISTFGCNNGLILAGSRAYYAMAKDRLFFKSVGNLNRKGVPAFALWIQGIWASLLCLSGSYSALLDYVIFAVLIFYVLTIAGIFILRKKRPDLPRPYKAFGYPVLPSIYIFAATLIAILLLVYKTDNTWPGLLIVLLGIPVYFLWKRK
ncbi:MAG: amino acid permease [Bacteroidetes bacterium]|nr:amino acid permease [Bacteroidota bacterium]